MVHILNGLPREIRDHIYRHLAVQDFIGGERINITAVRVSLSHSTRDDSAVRSGWSSVELKDDTTSAAGLGLDFPAEYRNRIFHGGVNEGQYPEESQRGFHLKPVDVIIEDKFFETYQRCTDTPIPSLALMRTCRQVYAEMTEVFYRENKFCFLSTSNFPLSTPSSFIAINFLNDRSQEALKNIRHVSLKLELAKGRIVTGQKGIPEDDIDDDIYCVCPNSIRNLWRIFSRMALQTLRIQLEDKDYDLNRGLDNLIYDSDWIDEFQKLPNLRRIWVGIGVDTDEGCQITDDGLRFEIFRAIRDKKHELRSPVGPSSSLSLERVSKDVNKIVAKFTGQPNDESRGGHFQDSESGL
ncbi:hypothetical protein NA57DRAFT_56935 [Rhizodiscina lignyota]|uniref:DUF7730 domain-containing protein n=1 Tax=Rhizodiscina lignyota TaxID=1504668 RepID=A0A9P4M4I4_9PEZI|nr:hypothetical protein NA57DRAFT_56935 [Rhizodiscina lignyota]